MRLAVSRRRAYTNISDAIDPTRSKPLLDGAEAWERDPDTTRERLQQELTWGVATLWAAPLCLVLLPFALMALFVEAFIGLFAD